MNILIVGLGLIGGSYASGLSKKGHSVYGVDVNLESIRFAIENKYILYGSNNPEEFINKCEVLILGLYPKDIKNFVIKYNHLFTKNQIITDVCGVKSSFIYEVTALCKNATYLSHHPMAGREKSGITYADYNIFKNMNYLICPLVNTKEESINVIKKIGLDLEFGKITIIDSIKHDKMISFTSQLTHAIAVSLVNSDRDVDTKNFIGDSYRDLTRIAMINEKLWSELFFENKQFLLEKIESFENELNKLKKSLKNDDKEALEELFISSTKKRKEMEK